MKVSPTGANVAVNAKEGEGAMGKICGKLTQLANPCR
jgi:hypothetical protein